MTGAPDPGLEALLEFLRRSRGLDFTGYKRPSLDRRVRRRMAALDCDSFGDYLDHLEVHPEEYEALFDSLLINVTEFFRDGPAWERLRAEVLPELLAAKPPDEPIRVWSAGCSTGQEAYTAAMVLGEAAGVDALRGRVKLYATDIDEEALAGARQGVYTAKQVEGVPAELRDKYFEPADQRFAFRSELRRTVILGSNNLVTDAPISRLDLLICRNTLMYFTAEMQARILHNLHFALRAHGVLMLGRPEMLLSHRDAFAPVDAGTRIFRKLDRPVAQPRAAVAADGHAESPLAEGERVSRDAALELGPHAQVIVSRAGLLTFANLAARTRLGVSSDDLGRPLGELELAHRPVELRPAVEEALRERRRVAVGEVPFRPGAGEERRLAVGVTPLLTDAAMPDGVSVLFEDVTRSAALQHELEASRRDLELAYEELQSTIDELETTNEELQSANEELQTTNEELQSTNEELETMNEELQSTNEELETINDELRDRTGELNELNEFLEAILASLGVGVAVVDRQQRVRVWNHRAEDLWGLRRDEAVEQHLLSLDIGLPVEQLAGALRSVLGGASPREQATLQAVNRRGRTIGCSTTILPLRGREAVGDGVRGAIVLMEDGE